MTKILCVGDIHVADNPPANCTESYTDDIIDILKWVAEYAARTEVDAVVWAGDIFHHKAPSRNSHALVLKMISAVRAYIDRGLDLRIVVGNHDLSNDVLDTLHVKQPLGVLYAAGAKELVGWHDTLPLYGVPWQQEWTTNTPKALEKAFDSWNLDPWRFEPELEDINYRRPRRDCLTVTHAPIYPPAQVERGVPFDLVPTSGKDSLSEAMGGEGSLYYGHIHEDHGIFSDGGVTFANMGAVSRGSLHEYNLERSIKVALWTNGDEEAMEMPDGTFATTLGEPGFIEIPVPHKPASEVFRLDQAMENKEARLSLGSFLNQVGSASLDISSTASVISHLKSLSDVPEPVVARAIEFLEASDG